MGLTNADSSFRNALRMGVFMAALGGVSLSQAKGPPTKCAKNLSALLNSRKPTSALEIKGIMDSLELVGTHPSVGFDSDSFSSRLNHEEALTLDTLIKRHKLPLKKAVKELGLVLGTFSPMRTESALEILEAGLAYPGGTTSLIEDLQSIRAHFSFQRSTGLSLTATKQSQKTVPNAEESLSILYVLLKSSKPQKSIHSAFGKLQTAFPNAEVSDLTAALTHLMETSKVLKYESTQSHFLEGADEIILIAREFELSRTSIGFSSREVPDHPSLTEAVTLRRISVSARMEIAELKSQILELGQIHGITRISEIIPVLVETLKLN